jgi:ABC-2 type transport system permease protein
VTALTGTGKLVRLILRRDRVLLPLWIVVFAGLMASIVASFQGLFPTAAERQSYADASAADPGFTSLYGPLHGSSLGELTVWRAGFYPVLIALIALLTVIRHTRTEEDSGRRELLGATVVGRHAALAAALIVTLAANLVLAVAVAAGLAGQNLPVAGSVAAGLELAAAGWAFAAVGAVAAQLTSGAGAARGIAVGVLGGTWLLRVIGDVSGLSGGGLGWLSWLSPIGWAHKLRPYAGERWWVLVLPVALTALGAAVAVALEARRDVGAGLLPDRPGPATAAPGLASPLALAWRLHRGLLAAWLAGFAVVGVVLGGAASSVGDMVADNANLEDIFTRLGGRTGIVDAYLVSVLTILGLLAAGYAIQATLRLRAEETAGRAEPVLASAVGRLQWAASHLAFSVLGSALALVAAGVTVGLTYGQLSRVMEGALVQVPAVWVLAAVAVALVGLAPRLAAAAWGALGVCVVLVLVGAALQLDQWVMDLSPFTHLPKVPGAALSATPLVLLLAVALALGGAGLAGLRRRGIPAIEGTGGGPVSRPGGWCAGPGRRRPRPGGRPRAWPGCWRRSS